MPHHTTENPTPIVLRAAGYQYHFADIPSAVAFADRLGGLPFEIAYEPTCRVPASLPRPATYTVRWEPAGEPQALTFSDLDEAADFAEELARAGEIFELEAVPAVATLKA